MRVSNKIAINMYKNLGYIVYRTVIDYYAGPGDIDEDAFGKYKHITTGIHSVHLEFVYVFEKSFLSTSLNCICNGQTLMNVF